MLAFEMSIDAAIEFYRRVELINAKTEVARTAILVAMAEEGLIKRAWETQRTKEQFIADLRKHSSVLEVGGEQQKGCTEGNREAGETEGQNIETD